MRRRSKTLNGQYTRSYGSSLIFTRDPALVAPDGKTIGYTSLAWEACRSAFGYAGDMRQDNVEPYHVLFGLLRTEDSVFKDVLMACGVDVAGLRTALEAAVPRAKQSHRHARMITPQGLRLASRGSWQMTFRTQVVDDIAEQEAIRSGVENRTTGHILLGLLGEGLTVAAQVLFARGVDADEFRYMMQFCPLETP